MNHPIELSALALENLKSLSPDNQRRFDALFRNSDFIDIRGERLAGTEPDTFVVRLGGEARAVYRLLDHGKRLLILNVYAGPAVFDRA
jgi:mRNA-degrading endonuclease RelE of RelBE toxin-antitoxin system